MDEGTRDAVVKNEALFREVNDRVKEIDEQHAIPTAERWDFLCECGHGDCLERISMREDEYELLRSNALHFAVIPGHELAEVERVVGRGDGFLVVEKSLPHGQAVARESDPRS